MLTLNLFNDWSYERELLVNMREHVYQKCKTRDLTTLVDTALRYSSMLQNPTTEIYGNKKFNTLKKYFTSSSFNNFYFGKEVCGAYSAFFSRLMATMGYETKTTQMNVNGQPGGHMAVCIMDHGKLLAVDPLFGHNFKDANGNMSDIHAVAANWNNYYRYHLPAKYVPDYNYQYGWTFTNWDKFGSFSRGIYHVLCNMIGKEKVDNFSFYYYVKGFSKYYMLLSFFLFVFTFVKAIQLNFNLNKYNGLLERKNAKDKMRKAA
jgi:hypothetical protein